MTHLSGGMLQRNRIQQTLTVDEKADKNLWWEGPKYLKTKPSQWPVNRAAKETVPEGGLKKQDKGIKRTPQCVMGDTVMVNINENIPWRLEPTHLKLVTSDKSTSLVQRLLSNC